LLIRGLLSFEMARPIGPVGIAQLAGQAVQQSVEIGWWFPILNLVALLSGPSQHWSGGSQPVAPARYGRWSHSLRNR
jgi:hypothetical protein